MDSHPQNVISYTELLERLEKKGKNKTWFDTLRTRHKLIHKPIVTSPTHLISKETGLRFRKGRSVFYLRGIVPFLERIIDLHDNEGLTYDEIRKKVKDEYDILKRAREIELFEDNRLKSDEFQQLFFVAQKKFAELFKWGNESEEKKFLEHLSKMSGKLSLQYFSLALQMHKIIADKPRYKIEKHKLEKIGQRIDYINEQKNTAIQHMVKLVKDGVITLNEEDWEAINWRAE